LKLIVGQTLVTPLFFALAMMHYLGSITSVLFTRWQNGWPEQKTVLFWCFCVCLFSVLCWRVNGTIHLNSVLSKFCTS